MKRLLQLVFAFTLLSCEEAIDWQTEAPMEPLLVVEGNITNERTAHSIRLTQTVSELNDKVPAVENALVVVGDGKNTYRFIEQEPGVYVSDTFQAVFGKAYGLFIRSEGKNYNAQTYMVPVTPLKPVRLKKAADGELLQLLPEVSDIPALIEVWLDWSHLADGGTAKSSAHLHFYTLNTLDVPQLFAPEQEEVHFPLGTRIVRKKYSLSPEQQAFVRSFLFETHWQGSPFDTERGNVLTNMSEGALGYFAANTVVVDTTYAE